MRSMARFIGLTLLVWVCCCGQGTASARATDAIAGTQAAEKATAPTLTPPSSKGRAESGKGITESQSPVTLVIGLSIVLAIFFVVIWLVRRSMPPGHGPLPPEAFAVLGRAPLASRQQAQLVRCGNKLLLVCASATGVQTLTEITDPAEVERLVTLCLARHTQPNAVGNAQGSEKNDAG
ncbi:MAG: flagellar biosynthetic protein FliO [Planctomycetaceae bacterium]|nr:flagellar biosynthetic protein FliO [Planctomycetaceae bacterium]